MPAPRPSAPACAAALAFALVSVWALPCTAGGTRPPLTEMEVIGGCIGADQYGESLGCMADREICESIRQVLRTRHANAQDCSDACAQSVQPIFQYHFTSACRHQMQRGVSLCRRYCNDNYPD